MSVKLLVLGKGWSGTYIASECAKLNIPYAATTRDGRDGTIVFDYTNTDQYARLPSAEYVIITFPLKGKEETDWLCENYLKSHVMPRWILLGSTGVFSQLDGVIDRGSPINTDDARGQAETALIDRYNGVVLNCSGLWGGERHPSKWIVRVATDKQQLSAKLALHIIHGEDIALAVIKLMSVFKGGERWVLTDLRVYDWWDIALAYAFTTYGTWMRELMIESNVTSMPRPNAKLGRTIDSRDFWTMLGQVPTKSLLGHL